MYLYLTMILHVIYGHTTSVHVYRHILTPVMICMTDTSVTYVTDMVCLHVSMSHMYTCSIHIIHYYSVHIYCMYIYLILYMTDTYILTLYTVYTVYIYTQTVHTDGLTYILTDTPTY